VQIAYLVAMATSLENLDNVIKICDSENPHVDRNSAHLSVIQPELLRLDFEVLP